MALESAGEHSSHHFLHSTLTASVIVSMSAEFADVTNTSYGRSHSGRPASWKISADDSSNLQLLNNSFKWVKVWDKVEEREKQEDMGNRGKPQP